MSSTTHETCEDSTVIHEQQSPPGEKSKPVPAESCEDLPPESFWVAKDEEKDWFYQNAIIQRKSSRKLSFSLNSNHPNPSLHRPSLSSSNHKTIKASLIGLPMAQKAVFPDGNHRQNKAGIMYFFRSLSAPGGKLTMQSTEPTSPQVSCLGRVGTRRERTKRTGLWRSIAAVLRTRFKATTVASSKETARPVVPDSVTPALADLKRLRSGRRSEP